MKSRIELEKFEPGPIFEKTIDDIKDNHLKSIASTTINLSAITLFYMNLEQISINSRIEVTKFEPEPTFEKTINDIKDNHLENISSAATNLSAITLFEENFDQLITNNRTEAAKFAHEPTFENTSNDIKANHLKGTAFIDMNLSAIT